MPSLLNRLTLSWVETSARKKVIRSDTPSEARTTGSSVQPLPIYTNPKTITLGVLVGMTKFAWEAVKHLPGDIWHSVWFPFFVSMILGVVIGISNLIELHSSQRLTPLEWVIGIAIALLNSLIVFGAVIGVSTAT